jgi:hypothetical protein
VEKRTVARGGTLEPVSGIGDEAYFFEPPPDTRPIAGVHPSAAIFVRVGRYQLGISMEVVPPNSADSVRPALLALAKAGAEKLR